MWIYHPSPSSSSRMKENIYTRMIHTLIVLSAASRWLSGKESACRAGVKGTWVQSPGQEDPLEAAMATRSSIPAWNVPWTEELGGLQSIASQRVGHSWGDLAHAHAGKWERKQTVLAGFKEVSETERRVMKKREKSDPLAQNSRVSSVLES